MINTLENETTPTIDTIAGDLYAHFREDGESYDTFLSHMWRDMEGTIILIQEGRWELPRLWDYEGEENYPKSKDMSFINRIATRVIKIISEWVEGGDNFSKKRDWDD